MSRVVSVIEMILLKDNVENLVEENCLFFGGRKLFEAHIKEELSKSYASAISAAAGINCQFYGRDYGQDGVFLDVKYYAERKSYRQTGFAIDFQLKATVNATAKNGLFLYDLEKKNYLDLIDTGVGRVRILLLYILPKDKNEWLNVTSSETVLKRCAYWCSLRGLPVVNNKEKVRIKIPASQMLTVEELKRLMENVKSGGVL